MVWGQPEVALYSPSRNSTSSLPVVDPAHQPGYPDFIVDAGSRSLYITETDKTNARVRPALERSKAILTPPRVLHQWFVVQNIQGAA